MKNADPTIERLLTGLRDAAPPLGMHRRIVQAVEARAVAAPPYSWRWRLVACAAALALWIVTVTVPRQPREASVPVKKVEPPPTARLQQSARLPQRHAPGPSRAKHLQAASYPAPPLPLTDQEKLLLRFARNKDAAATAILNDDLRAAQTAQATEQFQAFFDIDDKEMRSQIE